MEPRRRSRSFKHLLILTAFAASFSFVVAFQIQNSGQTNQLVSADIANKTPATLDQLQIPLSLQIEVPDQNASTTQPTAENTDSNIDTQPNPEPTLTTSTTSPPRSSTSSLGLPPKPQPTNVAPIAPGQACTASSEKICVSWPHGFVNPSTNKPVLINGVNILDWFTGSTWRYPIRQLAGPGAPDFNTIRIVISWAEMQKQPGKTDPTAIKQLDALIADADAHGFKVILDPIHMVKIRSKQWNAHPGSGWNVPSWAWTQAGIAPTPNREAQTLDKYNCGAFKVIQSKATLNWLSEITNRYKDNDTVIAIDLINEPRNSCYATPGHAPNAAAAAQELLDIQVEWISKLRKIDADKVFITSAMYGDFDSRKLDFAGLAKHSNVMWTIHDYYAGYASRGSFFAADGSVNWSGSERSETCQNRCYDYSKAARQGRKDSQREYLKAHIEGANRWKIPIFIGEYGYHNDMNNYGDALTDKYELYEELNLSRTYWAAYYDGAFELRPRDRAWSPTAKNLTGGRTK